MPLLDVLHADSSSIGQSTSSSSRMERRSRWGKRGCEGCSSGHIKRGGSWEYERMPGVVILFFAGRVGGTHQDSRIRMNGFMKDALVARQRERCDSPSFESAFVICRHASVFCSPSVCIHSRTAVQASGLLLFTTPGTDLPRTRCAGDGRYAHLSLVWSGDIFEDHGQTTECRKSVMIRRRNIYQKNTEKSVT